MEILWKCIASTEFWTNCTKICGNCAFPQNFHKRKLGEIMVFYAVLNKYSRRPLFRMLLISNIRYSEQNFKSLEFLVIWNISLFRTFFLPPWHEYHPLIRTFIKRWSKTSFFFYCNCKFINSIFKFQINVQNFTFFGSHSFI